MNGLYKWIGAIAALISFILLDGSIYMCAYNLGFCPLIKSFNMTPPEIGYGIFVLFAGMLHIFKGEDGEDKYAITDYQAWGRIISNYLSKLFIIIVLFIIYVIVNMF